MNKTDTSHLFDPSDTSSSSEENNTKGYWVKTPANKNRFLSFSVKIEEPHVDVEKFEKLYNDYKMTKERYETSVKNGWGDAIPGDQEWFGECQFELMKFLEENVDTIFSLLSKRKKK